MDKVVIKLNVHNTFKECDEEMVSRFERGTVLPVMATLIDKLSRKNPSWEFYASGFGHLNSDGNHVFSRFRIVDFGEEVGMIDYETHWRTADLNTYVFNGPRLEAKRTRGYASKTRNVDKAVKLICANISSMTLQERISKARSKARESSSAVYQRSAYNYRNLRDKLGESFASFVMERWDEFSAHITGTSVASDAVTLPDVYTTYKDTGRLLEAYRTGKGAMVYMYKDQYHVTHDDQSEELIYSYTLDTVPENIKTSVALLKLVEVGKYIPDVGIRAEDGLFYVIKGDA